MGATLLLLPEDSEEAVSPVGGGEHSPVGRLAIPNGAVSLEDLTNFSTGFPTIPE